MPEKNEKVSTRTTNKEHFKFWNQPPAIPIPEYPEFASHLIYPNEKRRHLTTNEELMKKNYKINPTQTTAVNLFENQFKINHGKMNLNTVYTNDYRKLNLKEFLKERGPIVTKSAVEIKGMKEYVKLPMETITQSMDDFKYDPSAFRSSVNSTNNSQVVDLFKSRLNANLKPLPTSYKTNYSVSHDDKTKESILENETNSIKCNFGESHLTHNRNIVKSF